MNSRGTVPLLQLAAMQMKVLSQYGNFFTPALAPSPLPPPVEHFMSSFDPLFLFPPAQSFQEQKEISNYNAIINFISEFKNEASRFGKALINEKMEKPAKRKSKAMQKSKEQCDTEAKEMASHFRKIFVEELPCLRDEVKARKIFENYTYSKTYTEFLSTLPSILYLTQDKPDEARTIIFQEYILNQTWSMLCKKYHFNPDTVLPPCEDMPSTLSHQSLHLILTEIQSSSYSSSDLSSVRAASTTASVEQSSHKLIDHSTSVLNPPSISAQQVVTKVDVIDNKSLPSKRKHRTIESDCPTISSLIMHDNLEDLLPPELDDKPHKRGKRGRGWKSLTLKERLQKQARRNEYQTKYQKKYYEENKRKENAKKQQRDQLTQSAPPTSSLSPSRFFAPAAFSSSPLLLPSSSPRPSDLTLFGGSPVHSLETPPLRSEQPGETTGEMPDLDLGLPALSPIPDDQEIPINEDLLATYY